MAKVTGFIADRLNLYGSFSKVFISSLLAKYIENVEFSNQDLDYGALTAKGVSRIILKANEVNKLLSESSLLLWEGSLSEVKMEVNLSEYLVVLTVQNASLTFFPNNYCFYMSQLEEKKFQQPEVL
jgi:hypothetical protein